MISFSKNPVNDLDTRLLGGNLQQTNFDCQAGEICKIIIDIEPSLDIHDSARYAFWLPSFNSGFKANQFGKYCDSIDSDSATKITSALNANEFNCYL